MPPRSYRYRDYAPQDFHVVMTLMESVLSEAYGLFTYRYFLTQFPHLCFLCEFSNSPSDSNSNEKSACIVGAIIGCLMNGNSLVDPNLPQSNQSVDLTDSTELSGELEGYIAMLVVVPQHRHQGIGSSLVKKILIAFEDIPVHKVIHILDSLPSL